MSSRRHSSSSPLTRRELLFGLAGTMGSSLFAVEPTPALSPMHDQLLDEVSRRACLYFWEQADPETGLVRDRADTTGPDSRRVASIAATGFGLSALCIADQRGYLPRVDIRARVQKTLEFLVRRTPHERGFYPHFLDMHTGERVWSSEYSSVDTAWLLCGILHAGAHFHDLRMAGLAAQLIQQVDWPWMLDGGQTLRHGWTPEQGFLPYRWDAYSELMAMYLLAIGSSTNPIPASTWQAWSRPQRNYAGLTYIDSVAPLFIHQYSHAWVDFRSWRDQHADYFENSRRATIAHRHYCRQLSQSYSWYEEDLWGVTASDSRQGYVAWGALESDARPDGTLVPCAAGGSLPFLPRECSTVLHTMLQRYGDRVWTRYGFVDAFHPAHDWYDTDVIGIDLGIMLLMAENARSGSVWKTMSHVGDIQRGIQAVRHA